MSRDRGSDPGPLGPLAAWLSPVAFASGCAALLFETLWFRVAGLAFGNGLWASSLVLAAFMAGLALGNAIAARFADAARRPLRIYAALEIAIGASGLAIVVGLPASGPWLAPWLGELRDTPWILNGARLTGAFLLLMVPSTAMGATLPVLVKGLARPSAAFGRTLGWLYGWNTLGAVLGALLGEALLIGWVGVRGSAVAAAGINGAAALAAWLLAARAVPAPLESPGAGAPGAVLPAGRSSAAPSAARAALAAGLAGALFLGLEVVWFRFLSLFVYGTALVFAVLLAVVLAGIALGGLAASRWLVSDQRVSDGPLPLALLGGASVLLSYTLYEGVYRVLLAQVGVAATPLHVVLIAAPLMAPTALVSGALFPAIGALARRSIAGEARTTGLLTLANTLGAASGSLVAGFVLLPNLGIEVSLFALGCGYALVALCLVVVPTPGSDPARWLAPAGSAAALVLSIALFPHGVLREIYLEHPTRALQEEQASIEAIREGRLETIVLTRHTRFGVPIYHRMFTDGFSMSATNVHSRRYMKAYVYLPAALHPRLERALLISYGVGSTAKALTDTASLREIDVVDISPDVLEMSRLVFPREADNPLRDPRVRVHVEDGRFFLQTVDRRYDLITSEPPPPKYAGVVSLYSREYFELVRRRLAPGGLTTYWLPVHGLSESDAKAIVRAFCDVFEDCTLWTGAGLDWMLVGTRDLAGPVEEAHFRAQWEDPTVGPELRELAFERPGQLGATFLAGTRTLRRLVAEVEPLVDDFPHRLSPEPFQPADAHDSAFHRGLMDERNAEAEFAASAFVERLWPPALREATRAEFRWQAMLNDRLVYDGSAAPESALHEVLEQSGLSELPLWMLGSEARVQRAARQAPPGPGTERSLELGLGALADRDYAGAVEHLRAAGRRRSPRMGALEVFALCLDGRVEEASRVARRLVRAAPALAGNDRYWSWLAETFGMADPRVPSARPHAGRLPGSPGAGTP